jgi:lysylphosphatidylglycerol synthetase-like protein (DUF2156 family)
MAHAEGLFEFFLLLGNFNLMGTFTLVLTKYSRERRTGGLQFFYFYGRDSQGLNDFLILLFLLLLLLLLLLIALRRNEWRTNKNTQLCCV